MFLFDAHMVIHLNLMTAQVINYTCGKYLLSSSVFALRIPPGGPVPFEVAAWIATS
jgi:hypothetical protein